MLKRSRDDQRESVAIEPVAIEPVAIEPVATASVDRGDLGEVLNAGPTDSLTDRSPTWGGGANNISGELPAAAAPIQSIGSIEAVPRSSRQRTLRWSVVAVSAALLLGLVGWMLVREPESADPLPWIPTHPSPSYTWNVEVDRVLSDQVWVIGSADQAYVVAGNETTGQIDALDADGTLRWSTPLDGEWDWAEPTLVNDNVLVATNGAATADDADGSYGPPATETTLTLIDDVNGDIVWQTKAPGYFIGTFGDHALVIDDQFGEDQLSDGEASTTQSLDLRSVDLASGEVTASEHFDQISVPVPSTSDGAAFAAVRNGEAFVASHDLRPASAPIPVGSGVVVGFDGQHLLTIDGETVSAYDSNGDLVATGSTDGTDVAEAFILLGYRDGVWLYNGGSPAGDSTCGAFRLDDAGLTVVWQRDDCYAWQPMQLDDGTTVVPVYEGDYDDIVTIINLAEGTERASGVNTQVGANGFAFATDAELVATSLASSAPRFELALGSRSRWFLLDGALAIVEPDNTGSANAVSVTIFR